jgi:SAM-dependent methyltransferase
LRWTLETQKAGIDIAVETNAATASLIGKQSQVEAQVTAMQGRETESGERIARLEDAIGDLVAVAAQVQILKAAIQDAELSKARLCAIEEALSEAQNRMALLDEGRPPSLESSRQRSALGKEHESILGRVLAGFRGEESLIEQRSQDAIAVLAEAGVRVEGARVLDLGCGRGEMLEVLKKGGAEAIGIDSSWMSAVASRRKGLRVVLARIEEFLPTIEAASIDLIIVSHVIEHLPFRTLLDLLAAAARALRSGGRILIEVPNPANLVVAGEAFYLDPTHRRQVPRALLEAVLPEVGFRVEITRELRPIREPSLDERELLAQEVWYRLCGPQDLLIVASRGT